MLYVIVKNIKRKPDELPGQFDANKKENAIILARSGLRRQFSGPNRTQSDDSVTLAIVPRPSDDSVYRTPIPHKIFMEGEYDELHGEGHAGKERQE